MLFKLSNERKETQSKRAQEYINSSIASTIGMGAAAGVQIPAYILGKKIIQQNIAKSIDELPTIVDTKKELDDAIKLKNKMGFKGNIYAQDVRHNGYIPFVTSTNSKAYNNNIIPIDPSHPDRSDRQLYKKHGAVFILDVNNKKGPGSIVSPIKDKYILAHELGHGTGKNILARSVPIGILKNIGKSNFSSTTLLGAYYDPDKKLKDQNIYAKMAMGLTGVTSLGAAATLTEEARASIRGAKYLKELGMGNYKDAVKRLLPAYSTYAIPLAIGPYVGYKVAKEYKKKLNNKNKNNKK